MKQQLFDLFINYLFDPLVYAAWAVTTFFAAATFWIFIKIFTD